MPQWLCLVLLVWVGASCQTDTFPWGRLYCTWKISGDGITPCWLLLVLMVSVWCRCLCVMIFAERSFCLPLMCEHSSPPLVFDGQPRWSLIYVSEINTHAHQHNNPLSLDCALSHTRKPILPNATVTQPEFIDHTHLPACNTHVKSEP